MGIDGELQHAVFQTDHGIYQIATVKGEQVVDLIAFGFAVFVRTLNALKHIAGEGAVLCDIQREVSLNHFVLLRIGIVF